MKKKKHYSLKDSSVVLSDTVKPVVESLALSYFNKRKKGIVITSGTRTAISQAQALHTKLVLGEDIVRLYANKDAARGIKEAYDENRFLPKTQLIAKIAEVIQGQIARGIYISKHLVESALDIRMKDMLPEDKAAFREAVKENDRLILIEEGTPPHFHLSLKAIITPPDGSDNPDPTSENPGEDTEEFKRLKDSIKSHQGYSTKAIPHPTRYVMKYEQQTWKTPSFKDTLHTIGIGFNLERPDAKSIFEFIGLTESDAADVIKRKKELTEKQVDKLFVEELKIVLAEVRAVLGETLKSLSELERTLLINMAYDMRNYYGVAIDEDTPLYETLAMCDDFLNAIRRNDLNRWEASFELMRTEWYIRNRNLIFYENHLTKVGALHDVYALLIGEVVNADNHESKKSKILEEKQRKEYQDGASQTNVPNTTIDITPFLKSYIEKNEGRRVQAYFDTKDKLTIGVGFNMKRAGAKALVMKVLRLNEQEYNKIATPKGEPIDDDQINLLLEHDLKWVLQEIKKVIPFFDNLSPARKIICVDMLYNVGAAGLKGFKNFIKALSIGNWYWAAYEMLDSKWHCQVRRRAVDNTDILRDNKLEALKAIIDSAFPKKEKNNEKNKEENNESLVQPRMLATDESSKSNDGSLEDPCPDDDGEPPSTDEFPITIGLPLITPETQEDLPLLESALVVSELIEEGKQSVFKTLAGLIPFPIRLLVDAQMGNISDYNITKIYGISLPLFNTSGFNVSGLIDRRTRTGISETIYIFCTNEEKELIERGKENISIVLRYINDLAPYHYKVKEILLDDASTETNEDGVDTDFPPVLSLLRYKVTLDGEVDLSKLDINFTVDTCYSLPLNRVSLSSLLGDLVPDIELDMSNIFRAARNNVKDVLNEINEARQDGKLEFPMLVDLRVPKVGREGKKYETYELNINLIFKKTEEQTVWHLTAPEIYMHFPEKKTDTVFDFDIFSLVLPKRNPGKKPDKNNYDMLIDLQKRNIQFGYQPGSHTDNMRIYFPGGLSAEDNLENKAEGDTYEDRKAKRFECIFVPEKDGDIYYALRLSPQGVSFHAKVSARTVTLVKGTPDFLLAKNFEVQPSAKKPEDQGSIGEIIVKNNVITTASIAATMVIPGFKDLIADVEVGLRREQPNKLPIVYANMNLSRNNSGMLAELNLPMLQMNLESIRLELSWQKPKWSFSASADGDISFTKLANIIPDLEGLRSLTSIKVLGLDLRNLNLKKIEIPLALKVPVKFDILDGLFACQFGQRSSSGQDEFRGLALNIDTEKSQFGLTCSSSQFTFKRAGLLQVDVETGRLDIVIANSKASIKVPSPIHLAVHLSRAVSFAGSFAWIDNETQRYLLASGSAQFEGFPGIDAILKLGTLIKQGGEKAVNVVLYASAGIEMELFAGVVLRRLGGGFGVNNRLAGIDANPTEIEILERMDSIRPEHPDGWSAVFEDGLYVSIVASAILASNRGGGAVINAYLAELILSLDTEARAIAAGRLWLASSLNYAMQHRANPVLVGALCLSPRERRLGVALATRPNPAIEANQQLSRILNNASLRLEFRLTPQLVDYHLKEITYRDFFFGVDMRFSGNYRVAIFRNTMLVKAGLAILGHYHKELRAGLGGFSFTGDLRALIEFAGLLGQQGMVAYGILDSSIAFNVSAFIEITISFTIKIWRWKKTFSVTFRYDINLQAALHFCGMAAIADHGGAGFDGTVGISIRICGYGLSISPRLAINPGAISYARQRVAQFENELNQALQQLKSSRSSPSLMFAPLSAGPEMYIAEPRVLNWSRQVSLTRNPKEIETWLYYSNSGRHVLIPSPQTQWYTPKYLGQREGSLVEISTNKVTVKSENGLPNINDIVILRISGVAEIIKAVVTNVDQTEKLFTVNASIGTSVNPSVEPQPVIWFNANNSDMPEFIDDVELIILGEKLSLLVEGQQVIANKDGDLLKIKGVVVNSSLVNASVVISGEEMPKCNGVWYVEEVTVDGYKLTPYKKTQLPDTEEDISINKIFIPEVVLYSTWNQRNRVLPKRVFSNLEPSHVDECIMFMAESSTSDLLGAEQRFDPEIIYDPRVETVSRDHFSIADQQLPDHVLTYDFKSVLDVLGTSSKLISETELKMIRDFERNSVRSVNYLLHGAQDQDDYTRAKQVRARLIREMLDALSNDERYAKSMFRSIPTSNAASEFLGTIFQYSNALTNKKMFVQRAGGTLTEVLCVDANQKLVDSKAKIREQVKCLPIRQKFQVKDDANPDDESASIVVKLPIKLDAVFADPDLKNLIGRIEIYRQLPHEKEPILLTQNAYPQITEVNERNEISVGVVANLTRESEGYTVTINLDYADQKRAFKFADKPHIALYKNKADELIFSLNSDEIDEKDNNGELTFNLATSGDLTGYSEYVLFDIQQKLIINPYIYTDEFPVRSRRLIGRNLTDATEIRYSMRIVHEVSSDSNKGNKLGHSEEEENYIWPPVRLHVPKVNYFPSNLGIVFSVGSLVFHRDFEAEIGEFALIEQDSKQKVNLLKSEFEIWVKELPKRRSGFYSGDNQFNPSVEREDKAPKFSTLYSEQKYDSIDGKVKLELEYKNDCFYLLNPQQVFRTECTYQFYIRPTSLYGRELLQPMQHMLVQRFPEKIEQFSKVKLVEHIEWISSNAYKMAESQTPLESEHFFVDSAYMGDPSHENFVVTHFNTRELDIGGVEITIADKDDPEGITRLTYEVMDEDLFRTAVRDFRNPSIWQLPFVHSKQLEKLVRESGNISSSTLETLNFSSFYFSYEDARKQPATLIRSLAQAIVDFKAKFPSSNNDSYNWRSDLFPRLVNILHALSIFENSPLNIQSKYLSGIMSGIRQLSYNLLLGSEKEKTSEKVNVSLEEVNKALVECDKTVLSDDELLDHELAEDLLGILYRRQACAYDLLALREARQVPDINHTKLQKSAPEILPNHTKWKQVEDQYKQIENSQKRLLLTTKLLEEFSSDKNLVDTFNGMLDLLQKLETCLSADPKLPDSYPFQIGKIVPLAREISQFIDALADSREYKIIKRPHHRVMISTIEDVPDNQYLARVQPAQIEFKPFMSDTGKVNERSEAMNNTVDALASLGSFFNLLDYLGFAVDIALVDSKNRLLEQDRIFSIIRNKLSSDRIEKHHCFIVAGISPNMVSETSESVGFSFVKLVILPTLLIDAFMQDFPDKDNFAIKWLEYRGIQMPTTGQCEYLKTLARHAKLLIELREENLSGNKLSIIHLQLHQQIWQSLPVVALQSRAVWRVGDDYGHRFQVSIRKVSRYQPLIDWRLGSRTLMTSSQKLVDSDNSKYINVIPVYPRGIVTREEPVVVYNFPHPSLVQFSYQLSSTVAAAMKNQTALIRSGYKGQDSVFRYELIDETGNGALLKIVEAMQYVDARIQLPEIIGCKNFYATPSSALTVYDHERLVQIPNLPFFYRYFLTPRFLFHSKERSKASFAEPKIITHEVIGEVINKRSILTVESHQKITSDNIPFVIVMTSTEGREIAKISSCKPGSEPSIYKLYLDREVTFTSNNLSEVKVELHRANNCSATVRPGKLGFFKPLLKNNNGLVSINVGNEQNEKFENYKEYEFTIYLNRNIDYLTDDQVKASPPALKIVKPGVAKPESLEFYIHELPDCFTDYMIMYNLNLATDPTHPENEEAYNQVLCIRMPWSKLYSVLPENLAHAAKPVIKELNTGLKVSEESKKLGKDELCVPIKVFEANPVNKNLRYEYAITFILQVPEYIYNNNFNETAKFEIHPSREGPMMKTSENKPLDYQFKVI